MNQYTSKRRQIALRFFTYGVMTVAVVGISIICLFFVLGYRFDQTSGQFEQGALVQFRSVPSGASIQLNGRQLNFNTPGKQSVTAGDHAVTMQREGYRDWTKQFSIKSGSISWLNYARFVPTKITTDPVREFTSLAEMTPSPDRRWLAILENPHQPVVMIADIRNERQPRFSQLTIPTDVLALKEGQQPGKLSIAEWDFGSRYILLTHEIDGRMDFLRVDRNDNAAARNMSQQLKINMSEAHFRGTNGNEFYVLSDGTLRRIDLAAGTISRPFVADILTFSLYRSDTIAFTATRNGETVAGLYKEDDEERIVRTYQDTAPVHTAVTEYFSDMYMAIAHGAQVEVIQNPLEESDAAGRVFVSYPLPYEASWLQFSNNGRFVVAQKANHFVTYDLEEDKKFTTEFAKEEGEITKKLPWLDDYYLWSDVGGAFRMIEFDGGNRHKIVPVTPSFNATLSENGKRLFTIHKNTAGKFVLQSTHMILE